MALKDFKVEREDIEIGAGEKISLRGLSAADVLSILYQNKASLEALADVVEKSDLAKGRMPEMASLLDLFGSVVLHAPYVIACVIAAAADEPDSWETAVRLPVPVQLEAIQKIGALTFKDRLGFERFVGNVTAAARVVSPRLAKPMTAAG